MAKKVKNSLASSKIRELSIVIVNSQILEFVSPNTKNIPRYSESVSVYDTEVFTQIQSSPAGKFRILIYLLIKIKFEDDFALDANVQSETMFQTVGDRDEEKPFRLSEISDKIIQNAVEVAYSTTRGLILEKSRGTLLEGIILPILQPAELRVSPPASLIGEFQAPYEQEV